MQAPTLEQAGDEMVRRYPFLQSLVVVASGEVVAEYYNGGWEQDLDWSVASTYDAPAVLGPAYRSGDDATQPHNLKSCTKSVVSALCGIALHRGELESADACLGDLLGASGDVARVSVLDLLTMRSGLEWDEVGADAMAWLLSGEQLPRSLRARAAAPPGERWLYSTQDTHLLAACLARATGTDLLEYAQARLFDPLGITGVRWSRDGGGMRIGGSELFLTPPDMARLGLLYLRHGVHDGAQVVPAAWVEATTAPQRGLSQDDIRQALPYLSAAPGERMYPEGYGWLWWTTTLAGHATYYAAGYGGQKIFVLPALDAVVVQTASTAVRVDELTTERSAGGFKLVEDFVVPALAS